MDAYTNQQKEWLNKRFCECDQNGIYLAHQPIYGFRRDPSEQNHTLRYMITYRILRVLGTLAFDSFLDAGGGEGYKAYLVSKFWGGTAMVSDLSEEACRRSRDLFNLPAVTADLHDLPFADNAFDVVLCSESLEHISDVNRAIGELLRITRRALIITVPHEVLGNDCNSKPHGHINSFDTSSFSYLEERGISVRAWRSLSPLLTIPACLADARQKVHNSEWRHSKHTTAIYNLLVPVAKRLLGSATASVIVQLDGILCRALPMHNAIVFLLLKDSSAIISKPCCTVSARELIDSTVPYLRLSDRKQAKNENICCHSLSELP